MSNLIMMKKIFIFVFYYAVINACWSAENNVPVINFAVVENVPIGYFIGSIKEKAAPLLNITKSNETYVFSFWSTFEYQSLFLISGDTGNLTTQNVIDRESICTFLPTCILKFDVGVKSRDGTFYRYVTMNVQIKDINDNAPTFPNKTMTLQISEGVQVGSVYRIDSPVDRDTGANNSIQSIEIVPNSDVFGLDTEPNLDGSFQVKIRVKSNLDREMKDFYEIIVMARDGGDPPKSGSFTVDIYILDVNDNKPQFSNTTYHVAINETTPPNSVILTLSATDADIGENGWVTYRISKYQLDADIIKEIFVIDSQSGELQLKTNVTNQQGKSYKFIVEAVDHGIEPLESQAEVTVVIIDSVNNVPLLRLVPSFGGNVQFISISELAALGTFVANLEVVDSDVGENGNISCVSLNSYFTVAFLGSSDSLMRFVVTVNNILDRETQDLHNVTIICFDNGSPRLSSSVSFLVRVTDGNDNRPLFQSENYTAYIPENNDIHAIILQVSATDQDIGNNGLVQYYVYEDGQEVVTVGNNNGILYAAKVFDRETNKSFVFRILAIDLGIPALTGTVTVTLYIEDKNDQVPRFLNTINPFRVAENLPSDTSVGYLKAVDGDTGINAELSFAIPPEYLNVPFVVFNDGLVKTNKELDREQQSRYDFQVMVTDHGEPRLSSIANVTVFVTDDNDNVPVITYPSEKNNTISIPYPDEENTSVCQIQAYDNDDGDNSVLVYSISAGNDLGIFRIDENLGRIYLKNIISIDSDMKVSLMIYVEDKGKNPLSSSAALNINLRYRNATTAMLAESQVDSKYIIISVVVIMATIVISGAIIGIIVCLRRIDRNKKKTIKNQSQGDSNFGFQSQSSAEKAVNTIDKFLNVASIETDKQDNENKKNEASFTSDWSYDPLHKCHMVINLSGCTEQKTESETDGQPHSPAQSNRPESHNSLHQDRIRTQLYGIKQQQMILQSRAKQWIREQQLHQKQFPSHLEDSHSHTSGETIPSDSGRGGSEEEMSSVPSSADDAKIFGIPTLEMQENSTDLYFADLGLQSHHPYVNHKRPSSSLYPYTNDVLDEKSHTSAEYRDSHMQDIYPNESANIFCTSKPFRDLNKSISWRNPYFTTHSKMDYTGDSSVNSFFENTGTLRSHDEDDCSTTTSGSYTLYSEEIL
ncbi:hypothetical protein CHS0354_010698 [Potamilus streckersoni]|uniref:Cadherin domain-containing protein n=1 Tax=Potamilus streckersoni TaxID=2493646 RepID=A0AAE0TC37_9BIVA|nr:hypothetical protein CHS0354_010698 [Potamilus streckersoni]